MTDELGRQVQELADALTEATMESYAATISEHLALKAEVAALLIALERCTKAANLGGQKSLDNDRHNYDKLADIDKVINTALQTYREGGFRGSGAKKYNPPSCGCQGILGKEAVAVYHSTDCRVEELVKQVAVALWKDDSLRASGRERLSCLWDEESSETQAKWRRAAQVAIHVVNDQNEQSTKG